MIVWVACSTSTAELPDEVTLVGVTGHLCQLAALVFPPIAFLLLHQLKLDLLSSVLYVGLYRAGLPTFGLWCWG